jgi:glycosyltransferase involved in cell wall biosynthesis
MKKTHTIVMLLTNPFRPDPRVLKEAQSLAKTGYNITIICWDRLAELKSEEVLPSGIEIIRIQNIRSIYGTGPLQILALIRFWFAARQLLAKLHPDLIHCHDFDTLPAGLAWGKLHHLPVIYDAHEYYAELVKPRLNGFLGSILYLVISATERICAKMADAVVTVDETLVDNYKHLNQHVLELGHFPQRIFAEIHNPIFTRPVLTLLYAGRISIDRGALLYIDILNHLLELNIPARLIFAGGITPSTDEKFIHQHELGLEKYIEYLGWIPYNKMQDIYHSADIGLSILQSLPRYVAALPVKLFEYMASGLPVIASNFPSISLIINEENCGILVDPTSQPIEIARIIDEWWNNKTIPCLLGENGRQAVLSKYNWESQISKLLGLYKNLLCR